MTSGRLGVLVAGMVAVALSLTVLPAAGTPLLASTRLQASTSATTTTPAGSTFTPVVPTRLLDTRNSGGKIPARNAIGLSIRIDQVPADATAVVLNLTGLNAASDTYLSMYPIGDYSTTVSNLNLAAGEIRANLVTVPLVGPAGNRGEWIKAGPAAVDAVVDLAGYYSPTTGAGLTSLAPQRVLDTRNGTGTSGVVGKVTAGQTLTLDLSSQVPVGATAVVFNLTAVNPTDASYVTAWPDDPTTARPLASNLNTAPGQVTPNLVTVQLGANRKVNLYNLNGQVDLVADLAGYYSPQSTQVFYPMSPIRLLDTRDALGKPLTPLGAKATRQLGLGGWLPANASSAVLNLTGTNVTAGTYVTAWPTGQNLPTASNLNLVAGQTSANLAVVAIGSGGAVNLYNLNGQVDMVVDLSGYFAPQLTPCTSNCVFALGTNQYGRLGNGSTSDMPRVPGAVFGLSGVTAVAGDWSNGYALQSDGTVWAWGGNGAGQLGNGTSGRATDPSAGAPFSSTVPVQVQGLANITAIADGYALRSDGTVWSWGPNYMFRLGNGSTDEVRIAQTPVQVSGLTNVIAIAGNLGNGYALKSDGTVWDWGQNIQGELGNGTSGTMTQCSANQGISPHGPNCASAVPVQVSGLTAVTKIGIGMAVTSDGRVWRWGPHGTTQSNTPEVMSGLTNVTAVAQTNSGQSTVYALRSDGTVWAWGWNSQQGSYGNGTTCTAPGTACYSDTPVQVSGLTATAISIGWAAAYALKSDGTVWAWGGGGNGALGDGKQFTSSAVPVQIAGLSRVTAIGDFGYSVVPNP